MGTILCLVLSSYFQACHLVFNERIVLVGFFAVDSYVTRLMGEVMYTATSPFHSIIEEHLYEVFMIVDSLAKPP